MAAGEAAGGGGEVLAGGMHVSVRVIVAGQEANITGPLVAGVQLADLRRLWEAERAFNDLTGLRFHVDIAPAPTGPGQKEQ